MLKSLATRNPRTRHPIGLVFAAVAMVALTPYALAQTTLPPAREVSARTLPVPTTVSPQMQKIIGASINPAWKDFPKTAEEWKAQVNAAATASVRALPAMREALAVSLSLLRSTV
jgi:hypothetical protein